LKVKVGQEKESRETKDSKADKIDVFLKFLIRKGVFLVYGFYLIVVEVTRTCLEPTRMPAQRCGPGERVADLCHHP
jgi:hypothetical protein